MSGPKPTRRQGDLAEMLDTLLDKGVVVNADIAVSVGDTELLGIELRAAIASFETAAAYGLQFPAGTDMDRVHEAAGVDPAERPEVDVLGAAAGEAADEAAEEAAADDAPTTADGVDAATGDDAGDEEDGAEAAEPTATTDGTDD